MAGQVAIAGIVALVCAVYMDAPAGVAAGIGGGIGAVATLVQVLSAFRSETAGDAAAIARGFYRGEAMKIGVTVLLFVLALRERLSAGPLFAGYVASFVAYWVALLALRSTGSRGT